MLVNIFSWGKKLLDFQLMNTIQHDLEMTILVEILKFD
jgi:hypothetical protein